MERTIKLQVTIPISLRDTLRKEAKLQDLFLNEYVVAVLENRNGGQVVAIQPTGEARDITDTLYTYLTGKFKSFNKKPTKADYIKVEKLCQQHGAEGVKEVLRWALQDSFWKSNIMSVSSLAKHYDKLMAKAQDSGDRVVVIS